MPKLGYLFFNFGNRYKNADQMHLKLLNVLAIFLSFYLYTHFGKKCAFIISVSSIFFVSLENVSRQEKALS